MDSYRPVRRANMEGLASLIGARVGLPGSWWSAEVRWAKVDLGLALAAANHGVVVLCTESPLFEQVPEDVASQLRRLASKQRLECIKRAAAQQELIAQLSRHGIEVLTLKGLAMSNVLYGNWMSRGGAADIDLMVSPDNLHEAESVLRRIGVTPLPGKDLPQPGERLSKYLLWLHYERGYRSNRHGKIDLHWRTMPGSAPWTSFAESWQGRAEVVLPTGPVWTLGGAETLLVAAGQGESESWFRIKRVIDMWMALSNATKSQRLRARGASPLVDRSAGRLFEYWNAALRPERPRPRRTESVRSLWRIRRGSGGLADAAAKSALGRFAPAREIQRILG